VPYPGELQPQRQQSRINLKDEQQATVTSQGTDQYVTTFTRHGLFTIVMVIINNGQFDAAVQTRWRREMVLDDCRRRHPRHYPFGVVGRSLVVSMWLRPISSLVEG
jgi:hypothetical protein